MNFVPPVPQFTQQTYGMNYGDWQQYAGFGKSKPFGGSGMPMDRSGQAVPQGVPAPTDDTNPNKPVVPDQQMGSAKPGLFGVNPDYSLGTSPNNLFGTVNKSIGNFESGIRKTATDMLNEHYD
jgi:hypothetical protein